MQNLPRPVFPVPLFVLAAPIFFLSSTLIAAPVALEEVIVTAQKRVQGLIEVPISISVIELIFGVLDFCFGVLDL